MKHQYVFSSAEVDEIEKNISQIYNRIEQLEIAGRQADFGELGAFKEKLQAVLHVLSNEED